MAIQKDDNWLSVIQKDIQPEELADYKQKYDLITQFIPQTSRCNGISIHGLYFGSIRIICLDLDKCGYVKVYRENGSLMLIIQNYKELKWYLDDFVKKKFLELSNGINSLFNTLG